jgi:ATP-dependent helicase HepA
LVVQSTTVRDGLIFYRGDGQELCESELNDAISFSKPEERLLAGQLDPPNVFDLRVTALKQQHRRRKSKVRGFVGGRIDTYSAPTLHRCRSDAPSQSSRVARR